MDTALTVVVSVTTPAILSLIGAVLLGKLVPAGRVTEAEARAEKNLLAAEKYQLAYEKQTEALRNLEDVVQRQSIVTEAVNQVFAALKQTAQIPLSPGQHQGGPV